MVATTRQAAAHLGLHRLTAEGLRQWLAHTLRITGAHDMARARVATWTIHLIGRW